MAAMFVNDREEMSNLYRGPSIDPSFQNSIYLAQQFSEENIFLKWANQKQELPVAVMFVNESGRNEQPSKFQFIG